MTANESVGSLGPVAVMGVTGRVGRACAKALAEQGVRVRALVSSAENVADVQREGHAAEVRVADAADPSAMQDALTGVASAYIFLPPDVLAANFLADVTGKAEAIARAAEAAQVPHSVVLSSTAAQHASGTGMFVLSHLIEEAFRRRGLSRTFLRPAEYLENWVEPVKVASKSGVLWSFHQPSDMAVAQVCALDVGTLAAELLLAADAGADQERVVQLAGPEDLSADDVARELSARFGREVGVEFPPREAWVDVLASGGLGRSYSEALAEMYDALNSGRATFEQGVGPQRRGPTTLREILDRSNIAPAQGNVEG